MARNLILTEEEKNIRWDTYAGQLKYMYDTRDEARRLARYWYKKAEIYRLESEKYFDKWVRENAKYLELLRKNDELVNRINKLERIAALNQINKLNKK